MEFDADDSLFEGKCNYCHDGRSICITIRSGEVGLIQCADVGQNGILGIGRVWGMDVRGDGNTVEAWNFRSLRWPGCIF